VSNTFWSEVATGYKIVAADHSKEIEIERGGLSAKIKAVDFTDEDRSIFIIVNEADTEYKQPFIAPGGE
jgi:hypothetical protein